MKKAGVYKITCVQTQKYYIGSSKNLLKRIYTHKYDLRKNKHHSPYMQNVYNKYGETSFTYEIIEECENYLEREQYYHDLLDCFNPEKAFNFRKVNQIFVKDYKLTKIKKGYKHSEESKKKMSESKLGLCFNSKEHYEKLSLQFKNRFVNEETKLKIKQIKEINRALYPFGKNAKKVYLYDLNGFFIKEFISAKEVSFYLNCSVRSIFGVLNGVNLSIKKHFVSYDKKEKIEIPVRKNKATVSDVKPKTKVVYVYDLVGSFFMLFESMQKCANYFNSSSTHILSIIKRQVSYKKYYFSYVYYDMFPIKKRTRLNYKTVVQIDKNDNIINIFLSVTDAAKYVNIAPTGINNVCNNKQKTAKGYFWKYLDNINIEAYGSDAVRKLDEFRESLEVDNPDLS